MHRLAEVIAHCSLLTYAHRLLMHANDKGPRTRVLLLWVLLDLFLLGHQLLPPPLNSKCNKGRGCALTAWWLLCQLLWGKLIGDWNPGLGSDMVTE